MPLDTPSRFDGGCCGIISHMRLRAPKKISAQRRKPRPAKVSKQALDAKRPAAPARPASMVQTPEEIDKLMGLSPELRKQVAAARGKTSEKDDRFMDRLKNPLWCGIDAVDPSLVDYIDDGTPPRTVNEILADIQKFIKSKR